MGLQSALRLIYPAQCLACGDRVEQEDALCPACWRETPFISGIVCDACGVPLPGTEGADPAGAPVHCDDCLRLARPWQRGRAAMLYGGTARRLVLALKYADRLDLARACGGWLATAAAPILRPGTLVAPVPLHWTRLLRRRYNQSAVLAQALSARLPPDAGAELCPDLLVRRRCTAMQEGRDLGARHANLDGALALHPRRGVRAAGRHVLLVDDVMTSGATLAAAADACLAGGAREVDVAVLVRVPKSD
jgi:predicted amidophosphoribosyltransferase